MLIELKRCQVRSFTLGDAESLALHADNRKVWINLRDTFPHPYSPSDAQAFIEESLTEQPQTSFAIAVGAQAVGGIGLRLQSDVERVSAEIGYWLGETFWGRGITTEALRATTDYAIEEYHLTRVYAVPFAWNNASLRVLEKAGYTLEGRMRRSAVKNGQVVDQLL
ncbi:MAG: GNAT family N-acetyltransferase, partial [Candidatus Krumholzibacteria bacterium]|nr:GNAT family N-acetyltransferase [Candidatus Krumholzibacteria bacterium]